MVVHSHQRHNLVISSQLCSPYRDSKFSTQDIKLMTYSAFVTIYSYNLASLYNVLHLYFTSRSLANFSAPTVLLRKAAHKVCHMGLGSIFSHVLSFFLSLPLNLQTSIITHFAAVVYMELQRASAETKLTSSHD